MTNETLSIKLHELDEKVSRIYSRILMTESADHSQIRREKELMRQECEELELSIRERMQHSQSKVVSEFSDVYLELETVIDDTKKRLGLVLNKAGISDPGIMSDAPANAACDEISTLTSLAEDCLSGLDYDELIDITEKKILLAEYALDFAILTADHALLFSLDAMDAQMTTEEEAP